MATVIYQDLLTSRQVCSLPLGAAQQLCSTWPDVVSLCQHPPSDATVGQREAVGTVGTDVAQVGTTAQKIVIL